MALDHLAESLSTRKLVPCTAVCPPHNEATPFQYLPWQLGIPQHLGTERIGHDHGTSSTQEATTIVYERVMLSH